MKLDDFTVPGKNLKVTGMLNIKSQALNGSTSATDSAHLGYQPKKITVTTVIPHTDENDLNQIFTTAETLGDNDSPKIYTLVDKTANAMGIKQCRFTDTIRVRNKDNLKAWSVTFTLKEYLSVPEKIEQRQTQSETIEPVTEGKTIQASELEEATELSGFESILKKLDNVLA